MSSAPTGDTAAGMVTLPGPDTIIGPMPDGTTRRFAVAVAAAMFAGCAAQPANQTQPPLSTQAPAVVSSPDPHSLRSVPDIIVGAERDPTTTITNPADTVSSSDEVWEASVFYPDDMKSAALMPAAVPAVHPDVPAGWWIPTRPASERSPLPNTAALLSPRSTPGVTDWTQRCVDAFEGGAAARAECAVLLDKMALALDYLGADEACVLDQYQKRIDQMLVQDWDGSGDQHGWHRCATVIGPDPADTASSLITRCRQVLPAAASLDSPPVLTYDPGTGVLSFVSTPQERSVGCAEWAVQVRLAAGGSLTTCSMLAALASQWMQHYHFAPAGQEFSPSC